MTALAVKEDKEFVWLDHFHNCLINHNLANPVMVHNEPCWLADFEVNVEEFVLVSNMKCEYFWVDIADVKRPTNYEYIKNFMLFCQNGTFILLDREKPEHKNYGLFSRIIRRRGM